MRLPDDDPYRRPDGVDDATVEAVGKLSEAVEVVERARGHLYGFHQLMGTADLTMGHAADLLEAAGHAEAAGRVRTELVGRNVVHGRWTFQVVDEYDATYYEPVRAAERDLRDALVGGVPHLYEAEMKEDRRTHGARHHDRRPDTT